MSLTRYTDKHLFSYKKYSENLSKPDAFYTGIPFKTEHSMWSEILKILYK